MALEMQPLGNNLHDGAGIMVGNGAGGGSPPEEHRLLEAQPAGRNGEIIAVAEHNGNLEDRNANQQGSQCNMIGTALNEIVFPKVRLWMVIVGIVVLILSVILISLALCSVIHEDVDEKYDRSSFIIPQYFNGSFQVTSQTFTEKLSSHWSNDSKVLMTELQEKLTDLYRSSPALGRYFSTAQVYSFSSHRNGSAVADYGLVFVIPAAQCDQLKNFTLSREMVYNVFRQFLYDQEIDEPRPTYIDPGSLRMI